MPRCPPGDGDVTDPSAVRRALEEHPTAAVINASAYTAVDKAQSEVDTAFAVNASGPATLAALSGDRPLIHFSTDYVFNGEASAPYREDDETDPLGVYGLSKRVGERAVLAAGGTVIRTAWVYAGHGSNFLKTMIRVGRDRGALRVVKDQHGTPTSAMDIAEAALTLLQKQIENKADHGLFHYTAKGATTWHGFAAEIFAALKAETGEEVSLEAIPSSEYPTPAKRPAYSVLDCSKIESAGIKRPDWHTRVAPTVAAVLAAEREAS